MEWINNYDVLNLATERPMKEVPEWARAEHMEASSPLCELWKLSGEVTNAKPKQKIWRKKYGKP